MLNKVWDEITYPLPNFKGSTIEVWEWISNFIPHYIMDDIILYGWCDVMNNHGILTVSTYYDNKHYLCKSVSWRDSMLTHYGLVMLRDKINLHQHCFMWRLAAWQHQAITWNNINLLSIGRTWKYISMKFQVKSKNLHSRKCFWNFTYLMSAILSRPQCGKRTVNNVWCLFYGQVKRLPTLLYIF